MAGSARRITVEFLGDAKGLDRTADQVERRTNTLGSRMSHVGKVAGIALAGGLVVAGKAMVGMARNAAEDQAAQRKLQVALQNTTGATKSQVAGVEDWISKQGKLLGVTDDDLRPAFQRLAQATGDITKAQKLTSVAMDASVGSGKTLKVVTDAMAKAQNGSMGALSKLGIKVKDADGKMLSFDQVVQNMSQTFKGQASAAANSYDGKLNRLKVQFDETKESIGARLLPVMGKLMDMITVLVNWTTKHSTATKIMAGVIGGLVGTLYLVSKAMAAVNLVMSLNPIGLVIIAIAALVAGLVIAYKKSETFRNIVNGAFESIIGVVKTMWYGVLKPTFKFIVDAFLNVAGAIVHGAAKAFGWVPGLGPKLKAAAQNFDEFRDKVNRSLNGIKDKKVKLTAPGAGTLINDLQTIKTLMYDISHAKASYTSKGGPKNLNQLLGGGRHRAMGGPVTAGQPYIVGENRPELFVPSKNGRIVPKVPAAAAGGGKTVIEFHFHGLADSRGAAREMRAALIDLGRTLPGGLALP